jgi:hypothetical protein
MALGLDNKVSQNISSPISKTGVVDQGKQEGQGKYFNIPIMFVSI